MTLLHQYRQYILAEKLFQPNHRLLLAVSGGIDSVVLCELTMQAGYDFAIAHCNFQLRGEESNRDEAFVRALAAKYKVPVFVKRFDTSDYAAQHKCSIQVAARELRYNWFNEIMDSGNPNFNFIVTAHHANDNIETVLMNFFKGTGMGGLRGMLPAQGKIVRPLLSVTREAIEQFAREQQLQWVEDSSNAEDHYTRNYFRHKIIPAIREVYPQAEANMMANLQRFREVEFLYRQHLDQLLNKMVERKGNELHIPILKLQKSNAVQTILFELMQPFGFTAKQPAEALALLQSETGRYIASATHRIFRNRNWLIIAPLSTTQAQHIIIEQEGEIAFALGRLHLQISRLPSDKTEGNGQLSVKNDVAQLDAAQISFPLLLRPWRPGDYFYPLGMQKKKKLARFFIDQKLSATQKENTWVLEMNKKILWVIGLRIDDRFRITAGTTNVLRLEFSAAAP